MLSSVSKMEGPEHDKGSVSALHDKGFPHPNGVQDSRMGYPYTSGDVRPSR